MLKNGRYYRIKHRKVQNKKCLCMVCDEFFLAADTKASICTRCRKKKGVCPICGEPKLVMSKTCKNHHGIHLKGLTKEEIVKVYPTWVNCGFKKGLLNPNFTSRKKQTKYTKAAKQNSYGEWYRSIYEAKFSDLLHEHNVDFVYEKYAKMNNGRYKFIDFIVNDVLIEISGYAYEWWRQSFDEQIRALRATYDNPIVIIIPYDNIYDEFQQRLFGLGNYNLTCVRWADMESNFSYFLEKLVFYQGIVNVNRELKGVGNNVYYL